MVKGSINSKIKAAKASLQKELNTNTESIKSKYKTTREKYKEIRKTLQESTNNLANINEESLINSLFEDVQINEDKTITTEIITQNQNVSNPKGNELWDYTINDKIEYFDPECSYELTGYRPINETKGLDFNPEWFTEAARTYEETGCYTEYPQGSKPYSDYWTEQIRRCKEGYSVNNYTITGDNYFYLNFYRMQTIVEGRVAGRGREDKFPSFFSKQYEFFHYFEMAEKLHKDGCVLKCRGVGLSECAASLLVRPYTTNRKYKCLLTAPDDPKLKNTKDKCWKQLNWLDTNTNGGMRHLRQKINNDDRKRATKVNKEGVEFGWGSEINTIIADNADKIRGDRLDRLLFEEAGSNKILVESWIKSNALVELGGEHFGSRLCFGTGGQDMALEGLSKIFSNPSAYNVLPYKNYDTEDGQPQYTGFFIPAHKFSLKKEFLDSRGVTNSKEFKKFYENERKKSSGKDLLDYCAEHCFTPQEALLKQGDNMFDSVTISDRLTQLRIQKIGIKPQIVDLAWDAPTAESGERTKVKLLPNPNGKVFIYEPPCVDEHGVPYNNLYIAGIDSIDQGTADSSSNNDVSDFCIVIKKRIFGTGSSNYVAIYKDRPRDIVTAYETAMKLCIYYNCKAMLEHTKISIIMYFRSKKMDKLFMKRPKSTLPDIRKGNSAMIGYPATETYLKHGLELISRFVDENIYSLHIDSMLEQLLKYSWENKRKFDIIAAMIAAELGDEDLMGINPKAIQSTNNEWQDIGWYYDSYGKKQFGLIPKK